MTKAVAQKNDSLYQLVNLSYEIKRKLAENFGEVTDELQADLLKLEESLPNKADAYKFVTDDLRNESSLWKKRAQDFMAVAKSFEAHADRMEESIKGACIQLGVEELEGNDYRWKLQRSKPSVIIDDETLIPGGHIDIIQTKKIRKDSILEDLESGVPVPGAHLEESLHVRAYPNTKRTKKNG